MLVKGGRNIWGQVIGVLCLESYFPKPPGHIKHAAGFDFPVVYKVVKGVGTRELILEPGDHLLAPFIDAMQELADEGVAAITGSCGFLALYQKELAEVVDVPVYMSSLIQVPMVAHMLKSDQAVGIITAVAGKLEPAHLEASGIGNIPVRIAGMDDCAEFTDVIIRSERQDMDLDKVRQEVVGVATDLVARHPEVGALVLECTDLPPYAVEIQEATGRPVFDLTTLTCMVADAVRRRPYPGRWTS